MWMRLQIGDRVRDVPLESLVPTYEDRLFAAQMGKTLILERTARGQSLAGGRFAPYSPVYAAKKRSWGRNPNTVDLTGRSAPHMLQSLVTFVRGQQGVIGIYGDEAIRAMSHHRGVTGRLPERPWFDLSRAELAEIGEAVKRRILQRFAASQGGINALGA